MSLINSMLPLEKPIVSIEYQTGELIPELTDVLRNTIVDVRCTDSDGRQFIVEMQLFWSESFKSRVLLNASKAYVMQLDKAEKIKLLHPVYALNFVNEIFEKSPEMKDEYYHYYKIVNVKNTEKQIKGLEFLFVELPKFKPLNRAEKKLHELWLRFLTEINENTKDIPLELLEDEHTREAVSYMERAAYTKEQLQTYDKWKINMLTERGMIDDAREEGMEQGMIKGMEQGMIKGMEKGMIKGKTEGKIEIAVNLLKKGISIEDVCDITGLSPQKISELITF
ncbi:MAG: Rpn family recombination-promoting nuclease/putative transposase [Bacteroidales bacterium]|nr:Rpn family recombination-promoting nuclease/putative transposase [Bacteroidales bacterium]